MEELNETLKISKNRKSPGLDTINTELFKYGGSKLKEFVLGLFNKIWHNHKIPKDWETGLVINIYATMDRSCPAYGWKTHTEKDSGKQLYWKEASR
jgi:hypothetical protein